MTKDMRSNESTLNTSLSSIVRNANSVARTITVSNSLRSVLSATERLGSNPAFTAIANATQRLSILDDLATSLDGLAAFKAIGSSMLEDHHRQMARFAKEIQTLAFPRIPASLFPALEATRSFQAVASEISAFATQARLADSLRAIGTGFPSPRAAQDMYEALGLSSSVAERIAGMGQWIPPRDITSNTAWHESLTRTLDSLKGLSLEHFSNSLSAYAHSDSVVFHEDSVTVDSTTLSRVEIQSISSQITDRALNAGSHEFDSAVSTLVNEIRALKNPALEKVLVWIFLPLLIGLILAVVNPFADFYVKELLGADKRATEKKIRKHVLSAMGDLEHLDAFRFVSAPKLVIRLNPKARSPILGTLHFGQVVALVERRKDWSLIAWEDESGAAIQGWVFSRHLSKFQ